MPMIDLTDNELAAGPSRSGAPSSETSSPLAPRLQPLRSALIKLDLTPKLTPDPPPLKTPQPTRGGSCRRARSRGFSFAIVRRHARARASSARSRKEIHEEANSLGRHNRRGAVRRCRGAGARTELGVSASRCRAHEVQVQDAAGPQSYGEGDELARSRS